MSVAELPYRASRPCLVLSGGVEGAASTSPVACASMAVTGFARLVAETSNLSGASV